MPLNSGAKPAKNGGGEYRGFAKNMRLFCLATCKTKVIPMLSRVYTSLFGLAATVVFNFVPKVAIRLSCLCWLDTTRLFAYALVRPSVCLD